MTRSNYRPDIDGLRAIAVLIVVVFHYMPARLSGGFIGVDIFFVISGYLITGILLREIDNGTYSILEFYFRRIRRIFPSLLLVMAASYIYARIFLLPNEFVDLSRQIAAGAGFVSNLLLWSQSGYFDVAINLKPLMHLWSLGVEEQYYLVWPLLLLTTIKRDNSFRRSMILFCALSSFIWSLLQVHFDPTGVFYSPLTRFWELLAGAYLAALPSDSVNRIQNRSANYLSAVGIGLILFAAYFIDGRTSSSVLSAFLAVAAAFLVILAGSAAWVNRVVLSNRWMVFIGLISYPLYLWHWPIVSFIYIEFGYVPRKIALWGMVASIFLAILTYYFVERPLRRIPDVQRASALLVGMSLLLMISLATAYAGFLVKELSPLQRDLLAEYDTREIYRFRLCFLDSVTQTGADFALECSPRKEVGKRLALLWGDSLSAQLYSGLKNLSEERSDLSLAVAQRTASSCLSGTIRDHSDNGNCDDINASTRGYIVKNRPDIVVLNGRWADGGRSPEERIPDIIRFLRENGVGRIILFGPAPDWWPNLRKILLRLHFPGDVLPERMATPLPTYKSVSTLDRRLREIALANKVSYVSVKEEFCIEDQCLIRVSDDIRHGLITSDHDHMTEAASTFLMQRQNVSPLFGQPNFSEAKP